MKTQKEAPQAPYWGEEEWARAVQELGPYLVKVSTPTGFGTGFSFIAEAGLYGIATAAHVVNHAYWWEEPNRGARKSSALFRLTFQTELRVKHCRACALSATSRTAHEVVARFKTVEEAAAKEAEQKRVQSPPMPPAKSDAPEKPNVTEPETAKP